MKRTSVNSSDLKSVGYDEKNELLEIEFHSGGIYLYESVPKTVYYDLMNAASKGGYNHQFIKNKYRFVKQV